MLAASTFSSCPTYVTEQIQLSSPRPLLSSHYTYVRGMDGHAPSATHKPALPSPSSLRKTQMAHPRLKHDYGVKLPRRLNNRVADSAGVRDATQERNFQSFTLEADLPHFLVNGDRVPLLLLASLRILPKYVFYAFHARIDGNTFFTQVITHSTSNRFQS